MKGNMTDQDWEILSAYLDGELPPAECAACERRIAQDPALAASLDAMRALQAELRGTLQSAAARQPMPDRVSALLENAPVRIQTQPHRLHRFTPNKARGFAVAASLAAAAALLLVPQWQAEQQSSSGAVLSAALEQLPSRAEGWETLADGSRLRPVLSFPNLEGSWCREYLLADETQTIRGVACRDDGHWETRVAAVQTSLQDGAADAYRPASAADSDPVATFVESNASGDAASAKREAGLITRSWQ